MEIETDKVIFLLIINNKRLFKSSFLSHKGRLIIDFDVM